MNGQTIAVIFALSVITQVIVYFGSKAILG
jgi:hypothetical protein